MKRSGMIRKIDNLGRIVIPREIRKLLDLNTADEMEIFVGENNEVVFRKTNVEFSMQQYADKLGAKIYASLGVPTFVTNQSEILKVFGEANVEENKPLSAEAKKLVNLRHYTSFNGGMGISLCDNGKKYYAQIFMPILLGGVSVGSVIICGEDNFDLSHLKYLRLAVWVLEIILNEK